MVLNSTGHTRFTAVGGLRTDSGWSWTFRIARVTLHEGEVASLTSQTLARAIFFHCLTIVLFEFRPPTLNLGLYGKKSIRSELMILECSFLQCGKYWVHWHVWHAQIYLHDVVSQHWYRLDSSDACKKGPISTPPTLCLHQNALGERGREGERQPQSRAEMNPDFIESES